MQRLSLAVVVALFGSACVVNVVDHRNGVGGSMPNATTNPVYRILSGASSSLNPGTMAGYAITATASGPLATYRVVWTGDAGASQTYRAFWGTIWTPGHFSGLMKGCTGGACALRGDDFVSDVRSDASGGQRVDWDTIANVGIHGLDVTTDAEPVMFDFLIDGAHYPQLVFFPATDKGGAVSPTGAFPFGLTTL